MLEHVHLTNFRNYKSLELKTNAQTILIAGDNASEKTNILESIYFLAHLKSFRTPDNLLVNTQEDYFKIGANFNSQTLEAVVQINPRLVRQYKIDEQKVRRGTWKTFTTVLFVPQDLNMFELGPTLRRRFLNQTLSQVDLLYALSLVTMDHVLKQKSALLTLILQGRAQKSELEIWNQELARVSVEIYQKRKDFIEFLNINFKDVYTEITDFSNKFQLIYKGVETSTPEEFLTKLARYTQAEIQSGQNLFGPHRDDFIIEKDNQLNLYNSSRGELRAQILSLKLLQAKFLDQSGQQPIILLDDVFSELDETRRSRLISNLQQHQIFITTTEEHHLPGLSHQTKIVKTSDLKQSLINT